MPRLITLVILTVALLAGCASKALLADSPHLAEAMAALEPELAKGLKAGTKVWAVDPAGQGEPELLLEHSTAFHFDDMSPDGRYVLLTEHLGEHKGDFTAIPHLWDRTAGTLRQGAKTGIRAGIWSGSGFYLDWMTHLDLALNEVRLDQLEQALGLTKREREMIAISFSAEGTRFAALVGQTFRGEPIDLVQGNRDGGGLTTFPKVITGDVTQMGTFARLYLSPDGQWLVLEAKEGTLLAPAASPTPDRWVRLGGGRAVWAPDSQHVWVQGGGVYDLTGKLVLETAPASSLSWRTDGRGGAIQTPEGLQVFQLGGEVSGFEVPERAILAGFLPDGRLLVRRTVYPRF